MSRSSGRHRAPSRRGAHGTLSGAVLSSLSAPVGAALGVGSAVAGMLVDRPVLGLLGVALAAVPGVLQGMRASSMDRSRTRRRESEATGEKAVTGSARVTANPAIQATAAEPSAAPVVGLPPIASPTTSPLSLALPAPVVERERSVWALPTERLSAVVPVDLVKAASVAEPGVVESAVVQPVSVEPATVVVDLRKLQQPVDAPLIDGRVDTAELQLIWDLEGEEPEGEGREGDASQNQGAEGQGQGQGPDGGGAEHQAAERRARTVVEAEPVMAGAPRALAALGVPSSPGAASAHGAASSPGRPAFSGQPAFSKKPSSVPAQDIRPASRPLIPPYARPAILPPASTRHGRHASAAPAVVRRERPEVPAEGSPRRAARRH